MNIILIISDTYRYDNLFDRAAMPVRTPNLDNLTKRTVSLSNMYTSSFPTIPHRTDVISGRYGWPWYPWGDLRTNTQNNAPGILREKGYISQFIGDCPHFSKAEFNKVFDAFYTIHGQEGDLSFLRMNREVPNVMPPEKTRFGKHFRGHNLVDLHSWHNQLQYKETDKFPPRTAELAVEWLEENYTFDPFFLWVDFFDPHEPWDPPEYMVKRYNPDYTGTPMLHPNYGKASDLTAEEIKNLRAHYCAEAELVDRWVGRIIQKIDDLQLWDNSIVIFTTDHGIFLGEHNRTGKSNINPGDDRCWPLYPELAHLPFMIAVPGLEGGTTVDALLQPPDILPTMLDIAGVKADPPEPFHGRSFAPLLKGTAQESPREFVISAQYMRTKENSKPTKKQMPVLYTKKWAYAPIGSEDHPELYDLENDPNAEHNIATDNAEVVNELHGKFLGWLKEMNAPENVGAIFQ